MSIVKSVSKLLAALSAVLIFAPFTVVVLSCRSNSEPWHSSLKGTEGNETVLVDKHEYRAGVLLGRNQPYEAWRFAVRCLYSPDGVTRCRAYTMFVRLVSRDKKYSFPARALLEDRLVRGNGLNYLEKMDVVTSGEIISGTPESDGVEMKSAMDRARTAERDGRLPPTTVKYCQTLLASSYVGVRQASCPILLVASQIGGRDGKWAIQMCSKQIKTDSKYRESIWIPMYEAISGTYYLSAE